MNQPELVDFDQLWDYGKPAETEEKFRELLCQPGIEAADGYRAELLTQIARTLGLQRKFDQAHATLDEAENIASSKEGRPRLRLLLERGRALNSSGKPDQAKILFVEAWEFGKAIREDGLAVDAGHMVAIVEKGPEALRWNLLSLDLATSSAASAARKWRKSLHNNIGWTYFDLGQFDLALDQFSKSREFAAETGDENSERIARWSMAKALRLLGRVAEALEIQERLMTEREDVTGFGSEELGECLLALGKSDKSRPHFAKAYELLSQNQWIAESEPSRISRIKELSDPAKM